MPRTRSGRGSGWSLVVLRVAGWAVVVVGLGVGGEHRGTGRLAELAEGVLGAPRVIDVERHQRSPDGRDAARPLASASAAMRSNQAETALRASCEMPKVLTPFQRSSLAARMTSAR